MHPGLRGELICLCGPHSDSWVREMTGLFLLKRSKDVLTSARGREGTTGRFGGGVRAVALERVEGTWGQKPAPAQGAWSLRVLAGLCKQGMERRVGGQLPRLQAVAGNRASALKGASVGTAWLDSPELCWAQVPLTCGSWGGGGSGAPGLALRRCGSHPTPSLSLCGSQSHLVALTLSISLGKQEATPSCSPSRGGTSIGRGVLFLEG